MGLLGKLTARREAKKQEAEQMKQAPAGAQKLIQPINKMVVGLAYKNSFYPKAFHGFTHYGADYWGESIVWASGDGVVLKTGYDSTFGNTVVVCYDNVFIHKTGKVQSLVARYYHLSSIRCSEGQKINKDSVLGFTGNTGKYSNGVHLHLEFSTAVNDPYGVPGIYNTNMLHWATDTTIDPAHVLYTKSTAPDNQTLRSAGAYYKQGGKKEDWTFPIY